MKSLRPFELVVHDAEQPCPYLADRQARMPLRWPTRRLSPDEFDQRLAEGDRRNGMFLYRTACPNCDACEPIRIPAAEFTPSRRHRRILKRGRRLLEVRLGPATTDARRVEIFNLHRRIRGLCGAEADLNSESYHAFLVASCCETFELGYYLDGQLVAVAITDRGRDSLSAVYTYFDPSRERLSLGTFSILTQFELARRWGCRFVYLGLYIAESEKMAYKGDYLPHERLIGGRWQTFAAPTD